MRLSNLFGRTLREAPTDAEYLAHQLVVRAGLARPLQAGSYALLPLGMGVMRKIEAIIHAELARIDAQEVRTPVVQAAALWEQTGRYADYGPQMLRLADRSERALIIAPTHEEAIAELARREIASYRQMPALVYQVHTKYRDEIRTKGGLMRLREFTMLDAYSLDANYAGLDQVYLQVGSAFERIFERCGVQFIAVEAGAGEMGGREAREYMAISQSGEDTLVICRSCDYAANLEIAVAGMSAVSTNPGEADPMAEVATPDCTTIADVAAFMGVPTSATAKAVFFDTPEYGLLFVVIRGDLEVNEDKLRAITKASALAPASLEQIRAAGAVPGYASPVGLDVRAALDHPGVTVVADQSVVAAGPLVAGANHSGYHLRDTLYGRDWQATLTADIALARQGDPCSRCGAPLAYERGVEIGHIFKLGTRYTEALGSTYLDPAGTARPIVMGSYGIGIERLIQIIVEQHHDAAGIVWPQAVAPLDIHLLRLGKSDTIRNAADTLYTELIDAGMNVLYDDREESAGVKFNDADLIGLPVRVVVGERLLAEGMVEMRPRGGEAIKIAREELVARLRAV